MRTISIPLFISAFLMVMHVHAQQNNEPKVFRVVAVKNFDKEVISVSNEIDLYLPMKIYLPNAFTPNGDGLNDKFGAVGEGIEAYHLIVYNRWGHKVFESSDLSNKWDGLYNGKLVPFGEYSYQLLAYGKEFGQIFKSGSVFVLN